MVPLGEHFYTTSESERDNATANLGYEVEGTACYVYASQVPGTIPFFRLVDPAGHHLYTASESESQTVVTSYGFRSEVTACYVLDSNPSGIAPLFRLFNEESEDHFYTTDLIERDNAAANLNYRIEGIACYAYAQQVSGTVPLLRLFNPQNGIHFYTTSSQEADNAINTLSYEYEEATCYVYDSDEGDNVALFRLRDPQKGGYLYTTSESERDDAVSSLGFEFEGIACYVLDSDPSDVAPLFRLFRPDTGDHFYTTDLPERDNAVSQLGYRPEGIACYAYLSQQSGTTPFFRLVKARLMAKTAFRPARDGFAFANSWSFDQFEKDKINELIRAAAVPVMLALVPLLVPAVGIIDAIGALFGIPPGTIETAAAAALLSGQLDPIIDSFLPETYGLCGGMAYAALDYFNLNWVVNRGYADPPQRTSMEGTVLRDYIWSRLIDGFIAGNAQTTVEWMTLLHLIPESSGGGARELLKRSIVQWESLKNHIDAGEAWPLGLIGTTVNPSNNHQVLAYGYADNGDNTGSIWIYDDNVPDTEVVIDLNFNGPELQAVEGASSSEDRGPLKGFFCESYTPKVPPVALGLSRGISALLAGTTGDDSSLSYEATNFGIGPTQALQLYVRAVDPSGQPVEITSTQEDKAGPVPIESAVLRAGHSSGAVVSRQLDIGFTASVPGTWTFYPIAYLPTIVNEPVFRTIPGVGQAGQPDHVAVDFGALIQ